MPLLMWMTSLAPWVFQGIWKLLGPMLDPVVRNKIQMTKNTDDLVEHIPKVSDPSLLRVTELTLRY